jgi:uncharacterized protein YqgC (DUF456 family)
MVGEPLLFRWPAWLIAGLLAVALITVLLVASLLGERAERNRRHTQLGPLETMASGLLGLLLAFNFRIAQTRFDARHLLLIREANAISTAFLRCSVLGEEDRRECRDHLRQYAKLRIAAYDAFGRSDSGRVRDALGEGERIQSAVWTLVARATRANPTPANALLMGALNDVIDIDADRRASLRFVVPEAVSLAILSVCLAWAALLGYSAGMRKSRSRTAWVIVSLLLSVVFGVALDFDRPRSGVITTAAAERSMENALRSMEIAPAD